MLLPNAKAQAIPSGFRPFWTTASGCQWFVRYEHDRHGNITGREFAMYANVQPILDHNGRAANHNDGWSVEGKDKLLRRAASVPIALITKWKNEEGWDYYNPDHWDAAKKKLNDIDYRKLRTANWRV